ncbi:MAG: hypothetical protein ACUVV6_06610 [Thermoplasmatota archaeon]
MRRYFGAAAAVTFVLCLVLALFGGRRDTLESPVSSLPSLVIDQYQNETEVFVHGLGDFRFTKMTIWVSDGKTETVREKEGTYYTYLNTSLSNFTLNVTVWNKNKEYMFRGGVRVADPDEAPTRLVIYEERKDGVTTHVLQAGNLPWKRIMERVL